MGRGKQDPRRACVPFEEWPGRDRQLLSAATAPRPRSFRDVLYAQTLRAPTIAKAKEGYGRFLGALAYLDPAALALPAEDRVTIDAANAFYELMVEMENRDHTIVGRFQELQTALRIMLPRHDWAWLTNPDGWSLRASFRMTRLPKEIHHPKVLNAWGMSLVDDADALAGDDAITAACLVRDGLMIAILAHRAPRLRSLTLMKEEVQLQERGNGFMMVFEAGDMKNKRWLEYSLPDSLVPLMRRYLRDERPILLAGQTHTDLWVDPTGCPMKDTQIQTMIRTRSGRHFDQAFGIHSFRHCVQTAAKLDDPDHPGVGAGLLGITQAIGDKHYDLATATQAARQFQSALSAERAKTCKIDFNIADYVQY